MSVLRKNGITCGDKKIVNNMEPNLLTVSSKLLRSVSYSRRYSKIFLLSRCYIWMYFLDFLWVMYISYKYFVDIRLQMNSCKLVKLKRLKTCPLLLIQFWYTSDIFHKSYVYYWYVTQCFTLKTVKQKIFLTLNILTHHSNVLNLINQYNKGLFSINM